MIDFRDFIKNAEETVKSHYLGGGAFARWITHNAEKTSNLGVNEYGCADAVNILYTLNKLSERYDARRKMAGAIQRLQDKETGLFFEGTHDSFHTTAHCIAALELLDTHIMYPLTDMLSLIEHKKLIDFMESQPWLKEPCLTSHRAVHLYRRRVTYPTFGGSLISRQNPKEQSSECRLQPAPGALLLRVLWDMGAMVIF